MSNWLVAISYRLFFTWTCVFVYVCILVCLRVCMHVEIWGWHAGCLLWCFPTSFIEVRSVTEPEACQFWLVLLARCLGSLYSDKWNARITHRHHSHEYHYIHAGSGGLSVGLGLHTDTIHRSTPILMQVLGVWALFWGYTQAPFTGVPLYHAGSGGLSAGLHTYLTSIYPLTLSLVLDAASVCGKFYYSRVGREKLVNEKMQDIWVRKGKQGIKDEEEVRVTWSRLCFLKDSSTQVNLQQIESIK